MKRFCSSYDRKSYVIVAEKFYSQSMRQLQSARWAVSFAVRRNIIKRERAHHMSTFMILYVTVSHFLVSCGELREYCTAMRVTFWANVRLISRCSSCDIWNLVHIDVQYAMCGQHHELSAIRMSQILFWWKNVPNSLLQLLQFGKSTAFLPTPDSNLWSIFGDDPNTENSRFRSWS